LPSKRTKKKIKATRRPQHHQSRSPRNKTWRRRRRCQSSSTGEYRNPGNLRPKVPRMAIRAIRPRNDHPNGSEDAHKKGYLTSNVNGQTEKGGHGPTHTRRYARCSRTTLKPKTVVFTTEVMVFRRAMSQQDESANE